MRGMTANCKRLIVLRVAVIASFLIVSGASFQAARAENPGYAQAGQLAQHSAEISNLKDSIAEMKRLNETREAQIRSLEDSRNKVYGALSLMTIFFSITHGAMLVLQLREHLPVARRKEQSDDSEL